MATDGMKISEMPELSELSGDEYVPVVDVEDGKQINKKLSISKIGGSGGGVGKVDNTYKQDEVKVYGEIFNCYQGENKNTATGIASHSEGLANRATGYCCHTEGAQTFSQNTCEHAEGMYNKSNKGETPADQTLYSIGIGTSDSDRKNAVEVMKNGDVYILGIGGYDGTNYASAQTLQEVISSLIS